MRSASIAFALLLPALVAGATETLPCPLLASAIQVGNCPDEAELQYTFTGYCSDNRRMYEQDAEVCTDYQQYRKLKNVAHWESADGAFTAYLSCDLPAEQIRAARASRMTIAKRGQISLLACHYGEDNSISFTYRSRLQCKVAGDGHCAPAAACQAICE